MDFYFYRSNPDVVKYQSYDVMNLEESEKFILEQGNSLFGKPGVWAQYAIEDKTNFKLIGDCAIKLHKDDSRIAEIGITISHLHQNKGYGKETLIGIANFLFNIPDFHRIVEIVDSENAASINLLESVKFRKEGNFKDNVFFKGKWGSEIQYAMLKDEWNLQIMNH